MPKSSFPPFAAVALSAAVLFPLPAVAAPDTAALRDAALKDEIAWDIVEGLTTEVGPRLAASDREAKARLWSVEKLKALGFQNVHIETFKMPYWERGAEQARVTAPFDQPLAVTALGYSGSTGPKGIDAEVVYFPTMEIGRAHV